MILKKNQTTPLPMPQKEKLQGLLGCMLFHLIGCIKFLLLIVFVTQFCLHIKTSVGGYVQRHIPRHVKPLLVGSCWGKKRNIITWVGMSSFIHMWGYIFSSSFYILHYAHFVSVKLMFRLSYLHYDLFFIPLYFDG